MGALLLGIEKIGRQPWRSRLSGKKVGLLAHPASTTNELVHALDVVLSTGASVEVLFGPEHGFGGEAQDMEPVLGKAVGPGGIPVISLYGTDPSSLAPRDDALASLDLLIVDLFDVGARYYTFVWTALYCLRACHRLKVEVVVADRPNPLGGDVVEGAPLPSDHYSFVGLASVANRHGLTIGEVLTLAARAEGIEEALTVIPLEGWRRSELFPQTGLPFVMPSPNMPTFDTALVYPGACLIEGTWASEGRGTTRPFELIGAPEIDGRLLGKFLERMKLPGVVFRPVTFKPEFQKHAGEICGGVQCHVVERDLFLPYRTGVALLLALKRAAPSAFRWRSQPYEFVSEKHAIDLLTGSSAVRVGVEEQANLDDIAVTWSEGEKAFAETRNAVLLY